MKAGIIIYPVLVVLALLLLGPFFFQNISYLLSEKPGGSLFQGRWDWVLLYAILFSLFIVFLVAHPLKRGSWKKTHGVYVAFIVALFAEMFGIPLTIYLLSSFMEVPRLFNEPSIAVTLTVYGTTFNLFMTSLIAGIVSILALGLIILGWRRIYYSKGELVTDGIYSYMRHPQYLGIMLVTTAWLFAWPTLPLIIMYPFLVYAYYRLARREEKEALVSFGSKYRDYMERTPMLLPFT